LIQRLVSFKALISTLGVIGLIGVLGLVPYGTGRVGIAAAAFSASALAKSFLPLAAATLLP
jgi:hypothetical protein